MKQQLTNYAGENAEMECLGCAREKGNITIGQIVQSEFFDAHQDFEIPIEGFVILSSRRHIQSVDEFTDEEKIDFINIITKVRKAMREVLGINTVYLMQEEDTSHHFHFWLFPRHEWMEKEFGRKIQSVRPIMEYARKELKTEENIKKVTDAQQKLKAHFQK